MDAQGFDVIVIGGGAAGLSGALTLARARRSVLVLDAGEPRNAPAQGVHGYLTREGMAPAELVRAGAAEVTGHGGHIRAARVVEARRGPDGFTVTTDAHETFVGRRLLITAGLVDELPDIPGLPELWGHDVLHCPYCHGWEVRDQPIGVLGSGATGAHRALLLRQWSADVTLFLHTADEPTEQEWEQLAARGIAVVDGEVTALETTGGRLSGVRLASGRIVPRTALAVLPRMLARAGFATGLGLEAVEHPMGTRIPTDAMGRTTVPGVWAAGNVTDPMVNVILSAAAGMSAGSMINADLVDEDVRVAVARRRPPFSAAAEAANANASSPAAVR